jgi:membrane-associated phospholipid phosphatase
VRELFYKLPQNVIAIFSGRNLLGHALAIFLTFVIVMSGGDWNYYVWTRSKTLFMLAQPALRLGMVMPVVSCFVVLMAGAAEKSRRITITAWALGQATLLGYLITCCYKAFTGRLPPSHFRQYLHPGPGGDILLDTSHGFQFGFLKGGIFWGWPSGHTTVAFAMSLCLITLYPRNRLLAFVALLYAFYIGLSVSVTIHWCSEFVAGAIFGSVIGAAVGKSFRDKFARPQREVG